MDGCLVARSEPAQYPDKYTPLTSPLSLVSPLTSPINSGAMNDVINSILQYKDVYKAPQEVFKAEPLSPDSTVTSPNLSYKSPHLEALQALLPQKCVEPPLQQSPTNGVKIFQTKQGYTLLICNGYRYSKISTSSNGKKIYWRCTLRSCKGKVHTDVGGGVVYESTHDHPPMAEEFLFSCHSNRLAKEARQIMRFDPLKCIKDEAPYSALESTPTFCKMKDRLNIKKSPEPSKSPVTPPTLVTTLGPTRGTTLSSHIEEHTSPAVHTVHHSPGPLLRLPPLRDGSLTMSSPTNALLAELNTLRLTHHLCDVALCVSGTVIYAHRVVLAAASQYFRLLFLSNPKILSYIELRGVDAEAVETLVSFAYTGCLSTNYTRVSELLTAANLLHFAPVIERCCDYLRTQLTHQNCVRVREYAVLQGLVTLQNIVDKYICSHWSSIAEQDELCEARLETLLHFLGSDELCVRNESEVYQIIIKWVRRYPIYRQFYVGELLGKVRLVQLNPQFLLDTVETEEMVRQHRECETLLHRAKNHFLIPERHHGLEDYHFRKRRRKDNVCLLGKEGARTVVYEYNVSLNSATELTAKDTALCQYCTVQAEDMLYIIGGRGSEGEPTADVSCFDLTKRCWSSAPPLNIARAQHSAVVSGGKVYVFGGAGEASAESYSVVEQAWSQLPGLPSPRALSGLCTVGDTIYVIGGSRGGETVADCSVYNTALKAWRELAPLPVPLSGVAVTMGCDGHLYVTCSTQQYRFDLLKDCWESLPSTEDMPSELLQACQANGDIFAMRRRAGKLFLDCLDNVTTRWEPCCAVDLPFTVEAMCTRTLS